MDILTDARAQLSEAGYDAWLWQSQNAVALCFEDDSIIGFLHQFDSASQLLEQWQGRESAILTSYAPSLRASGQKAWNVYSVFLTDERCDMPVARRVMQLDENFENTRKIARPHVASTDMLKRALLPLLPIQSNINLLREDVQPLLRSRFENVVKPSLAEAVLSLAPNDEIAKIAAGSSQ
jgi:hypothetical protein